MAKGPPGPPNPAMRPPPPPPRPVLRPPPPAARTAAPAPGVVQRYAWAVLDSREEGNDIVTNNLARFMNGRSIPSATSSDIADKTFTPAGGGSSPVHLHGHGSADAFACLTASTLADKVYQKFGDSLRNRHIVFHSCELGRGTYLARFLECLKEKSPSANWSRTLAFGAVNLLVVNKEGISLVARDGVGEEALVDRTLTYKKTVQRKGTGWRVAYFSGNAARVEDVVPNSPHHKTLRSHLGKS